MNSAPCGSSAIQPEFDFSRVPATFRPLVSTPSDAACELCVTIPVYNEEADIALTLDALAKQTEVDGTPLEHRRYEVLVLANNCTDRTGEVVQEFAARHPTLRLHLIEILLAPPHGHVGAARRLAMDEACRRLESLGRGRGVIATTDGDTRVRPTWVAANLAEIASGADAVGGRILANPEQVAKLGTGTRTYYRLDAIYRTLRAAYETILNPQPGNLWPRHHHCFGASLAVTVEAYRKAGGLPVVHCLEDMAFTDALERLDACVRQSPAVNVRTSLRVAGRVDVGLSWTLTNWTRAAAAGEPLLLDSPDTIAQEARNRRFLRALWKKGYSPAAGSQAALELGVEAEWFDAQWRRAQSAGELCQLVCRHQRETRTGPWALPPMDVREAIFELRRRLATRRAELRAVSVMPARKGRAGIFPPVDLASVAGVRPWTPRETFREPDLRSAGNPGQRASNGPAAGDHPVPMH